MQYFQVFLFVVIQVIPGASVVVYLPFVRATINTSAEFSKEHVFILLNQIILLDEFPRGRVGRPKNMRIIMDFSLFCNIAFAKKKKTRLTGYIGNSSIWMYSFSSVMFID